MKTEAAYTITLFTIASAALLGSAGCIQIDPCFSDADCDDGVFCNGVESCNEQGLCVSNGGPCGPGVCDELEQACVEPEPCGDDADCLDDGLFCNGVESCDQASGFCVSSGNPCPTDGPCPQRHCYEDGDFCDGCPPGSICDTLRLELTLEQDDLAGSACDDFIAALSPTLQTGDRVDAGGGNDLLQAIFNFTVPTTIAPTLMSVETVDVYDLGSAITTLDAADVIGTTQIRFRRGRNTNAFVVTSLTALADLTVTNQNVGATLGFTTAATAGSDDRVTITLDGMTGGGVTLVTDANNGIETVNLVSVSEANTLSAIMVNGATLTALNISGDAPLTLGGPVTAHVINATTFAAGLTMTATSVHATHVVGGGGNDTLYGTSLADAIAGGPGNDVIVGLAGADLITTGSGNNVLVMGLGDAGDVIADFAAATDSLDWNSPLASIDGTVTMPGAAAAFQSAPAGTVIAATTTVFELTGTTVVSQTAANLVAALGATANATDTNANILFVVYDAGGAAIWNWVNADASVDAEELTLVATLGGVSIDSLMAGNFR